MIHLALMNPILAPNSSYISRLKLQTLSMRGSHPYDKDSYNLKSYGKRGVGASCLAVATNLPIVFDAIVNFCY